MSLSCIEHDRCRLCHSLATTYLLLAFTAELYPFAKSNNKEIEYNVINDDVITKTDF